jgi:DNA-binding protein HU-beta
LPDLRKEDSTMTKADLIARIAKDAKVSKKAGEVALNTIVKAVKETLKKGQSLTLVGFGTFSLGKRAARMGRNPQTGAAIKIKAAKVPKFRAGKALKDAVK